jgi:hypothetical protein
VICVRFFCESNRKSHGVHPIHAHSFPHLQTRCSDYHLAQTNDHTDRVSNFYGSAYAHRESGHPAERSNRLIESVTNDASAEFSWEMVDGYLLYAIKRGSSYEVSNFNLPLAYTNLMKT